MIKLSIKEQNVTGTAGDECAICGKKIVHSTIDFGLFLVSDDDLVFCQSDGSPYLPNTISHAWIKSVKKCGLDGVRLHDARHTHATLLFKSGVSAKVIQERLGHSSVAFTMNTYAHVSPGMQKQAANRFDKTVIPDKSNSNSKVVDN